MKLTKVSIDLGHFSYTNFGFQTPSPSSLLIHPWGWAAWGLPSAPCWAYTAPRPNCPPPPSSPKLGHTPPPAPPPPPPPDDFNQHKAAHIRDNGTGSRWYCTPLHRRAQQPSSLLLLPFHFVQPPPSPPLSLLTPSQSVKTTREHWPNRCSGRRGAGGTRPGHPQSFA